MKNNFAVIFGVAVFLIIAAGWIYFLPKSFSRVAKGDSLFSDAASAGSKIYGDILGAQASIDKGMKAVDAAIFEEASKAAAIDSIKTKIEAKNKIKAAFGGASDDNPAPSDTNSHER